MANKKTRNKAEQQQVQPEAKTINTTQQEGASTISPQWKLIFNISLVVVFILMTIMSFSFGLSGDEVDMNEYGKAILKYFSTFGSDQTVFNMPEQYDRDGVILYYGGFFDLVCAFINQFSPFDEYTTRHILNAWFGFLAIFFSAKIVKLISDKRGATLAVWLMFLSPFFLGHAMNNPKDIPLAAGYIASVYFIIRFFEKYPAVKWTDYLWVILSIGITINVRVAGILLIPYLFVYVGILYLIRNFKTKERFELKNYWKPLIIISVLGYLAGSLFWPYGLKNPISNPLTALSEMSNFKVNLGQIWEGEKVFSGELPQSYLIKSFFITNTYALLAGLLLFITFLRAPFKSSRSHVIYFVAFTAFFPLLYIIYKKSNVYHAWRHVLFIFPSIIVLASLGWTYFNSFAKRAYGKAGIGIGIAFILLIEPVIFIISTYPNTVTYYNAFAGGVNGAYGNYEVDYYYNSVKQCTDYFIEHELPTLPKNKETVVLSNASHLVYQYIGKYDNVGVDYLRYQERNVKNWDYAIFHIALIPLPDIQSGTWVPDDAIFVASVKGNPLCVLLKRKSTSDIKAYDALNSGNTEEAIEYFKEHLEKDKNNAQVMSTLARVYMEQRNIDSAYVYAKKAYDLNPTDVENKRVYGMALINFGRYEEALKVFNEIVSERPDFIAGYYYIGLIYKGMGQYQKVIENMTIAAKEPALTKDCYLQMADAYKMMGNEQAAQQAYQAAQQAG